MNHSKLKRCPDVSPQPWTANTPDESLAIQPATVIFVGEPETGAPQFTEAVEPL